MTNGIIIGGSVIEVIVGVALITKIGTATIAATIHIADAECSPQNEVAPTIGVMTIIQRGIFPGKEIIILIDEAAVMMIIAKMPSIKIIEN